MRLGVPLGAAILVTRPEPGLADTLQAVAALGFEPVACPMLRIVARTARLPGAASLDAILLTSGQAVGPLAAAALADDALRALPVLAVGDSTAARAIAAGFLRCESASGDADDLAALVQARLPAGAALLLATGSGQGMRLARTLREAGFRLRRRTVYAATAVRTVPGPARAALRERRIAACLFFSTETARNFVRSLPVLLHPALNGVAALAISPAVAAALETLPWKSVRIASHPDAASLLSLLRSLS